MAWSSLHSPVIGEWRTDLDGARESFDDVWEDIAGLRDGEAKRHIQIAYYSERSIDSIVPEGNTIIDTIDDDFDAEPITKVVHVTDYKERVKTGKKTPTGKDAYKWKVVKRKQTFEVMYRIIAWEHHPKPGMTDSGDNDGVKDND